MTMMYPLDKDYWVSVARNLVNRCGSDDDVYIFKTFQGTYWLGTRKHDFGGTDYAYLHQITFSMAIHILDEVPGVFDFNNKIKQTREAMTGGDSD